MFNLLEHSLINLCQSAKLIYNKHRKVLKFMVQIVQESANLLKLSQTPIYAKFNETSDISKCVVNEITRAKDKIVKKEDITELLSLMKLNGDAIVKKAIADYEKGKIVIIFNKETSEIPSTLPFIINSKGEDSTAFIFANVFMNNVKSASEYTTLMAMMEAAYLAKEMQKKPEAFINNRSLMLNLCNLYTMMVVAPLEQKVYIKGENLVKTMLYIISFFYKMIDGNDFSIIPGYKKIISDKIDERVVQQIEAEVRALPNISFMEFLDKCIKRLNPVRYEDIDQMYMTHFIRVCGVSLCFALECVPYLFILVTSVAYRTGITSVGLNKLLGPQIRKTITLLSTAGNI